MTDADGEVFDCATDDWALYRYLAKVKVRAERKAREKATADAKTPKKLYR